MCIRDSTNTNVGIGTTNPIAKLSIVGGLPDGQYFNSQQERDEKSLVFNAGSIINSGNSRMLNFFDWPVSNFQSKSIFWLAIDDRSDKERFKVTGETGGASKFQLNDKDQAEYLKVNEDGNGNVFMHLPKPNSRVVIGVMVIIYRNINL